MPRAKMFPVHAMTLRLPRCDWARLAKLAAKRRTSINDLLRGIVVDHLDAIERTMDGATCR